MATKPASLSKKGVRRIKTRKTTAVSIRDLGVGAKAAKVTGGVAQRKTYN